MDVSQQVACLCFVMTLGLKDGDMFDQNQSDQVFFKKRLLKRLRANEHDDFVVHTM